jgi:hypothetical protein
MRDNKYNEHEALDDEDVYGEGVVRPMMHTTINKLKRLGKLKQEDMIGGKLTSEKARNLYKNNIRVHIRNYIPKDKRKYFHDEEITGGRLDIGNAFKKIGSTVKHTFNKVVDKVGDYTDTILHGRNDYPPKVRSLIKTYGDKRITHISVDRTPVPSVLTSALNAVSFGAFKQRFDKLPYDKLFHLRMDLTFSDNTRLAVEKNEVINMYPNPKKLKEGEQRDVIFRESDLTLNKLLAGGQNIQKDKWFGYSANNNNCQDFILAIMNGSHIGNEQDRQFVKQDTSSLFKNDSFLRKFSNTVTDIGSKVNEITMGAGVHKSCKQILSNNKHNMPKKCESDYESDSDSCSSSDSESYKGCGLHEKQIIQHIKKLGKVINAHQQVHGGKGDITGEGINASLMQLMENFKKREDADLKKSMKQYYKDRNEEVSTLAKKVRELPKYGKALGTGFKKGSEAAKEHMRKIRAMRKK